MKYALGLIGVLLLAIVGLLAASYVDERELALAYYNPEAPYQHRCFEANYRPWNPNPSAIESCLNDSKIPGGAEGYLHWLDTGKWMRTEKSEPSAPESLLPSRPGYTPIPPDGPWDEQGYNSQEECLEDVQFVAELTAEMCYY